MKLRRRTQYHVLRLIAATGLSLKFLEINTHDRYEEVNV